MSLRYHKWVLLVSFAWYWVCDVGVILYVLCHSSLYRDLRIVIYIDCCFVQGVLKV